MGWFSGIGSWLNGAFNTVKNGIRNFGGTIKSVANSIASGARFFSAIPVIGSFASGVATVADAVGTGVDVATGIVNLGENIQKGFGLDTGAPPPAAPQATPQPVRSEVPSSTMVLRAPQRFSTQRPIKIRAR